MVRGIQQITEDALNAHFKHFSMACDTPYIVKDSIVCGEVFTLIPLESTWCCGYMMLQCDNRLVKLGPQTIDPNDPPRPSRISDVLGEVTNMIWGYFKARYVGDEDQRLISQIQVPMLVKLEERNVSFGSSTPQLCFKYTLTDLSDQSSPPVRQQSLQLVPIHRRTNIRAPQARNQSYQSHKRMAEAQDPCRSSGSNQGSTGRAIGDYCRLPFTMTTTPNSS